MLVLTLLISKTEMPQFLFSKYEKYSEKEINETEPSSQSYLLILQTILKM